MRDEETTPLPSPASGVGEFVVYHAPTPMTVLPANNKPGVLGVPMGDSPEDLGERSMAYGKLALHRRGLSENLLQIAASQGISPMWVEAAVEQMAGSYMLSKNETSISYRLPQPISKTATPAQIAAYDIRYDDVSSYSSSFADQYGSLASQAVAQLREHARSRIISNEGVIKLLKVLQDYFDEVENHKREKRDRKHSEKDGGEMADAIEREGASAPGMKPSQLGAGLLHRNALKWGLMRTTVVPPTKRYHKALRAMRIRPGYVGALRYPSRALLPSGDGQAFGIKRRAPGGTVLIDCSDSMSINNAHIEALLDIAPAITVGLYASSPRGCDSGRLLIVIEKGQGVDFERWNLRKHLGSGNVVDGPAMDWLATQRGPRIWVSDGGCTGVGDRRASAMMWVLLNQVIRKARIKQFSSISLFLSATKRLVVRR